MSTRPATLETAATRRGFRRLRTHRTPILGSVRSEPVSIRNMRAPLGWIHRSRPPPDVDPTSGSASSVECFIGYPQLHPFGPPVPVPCPPGDRPTVGNASGDGLAPCVVCPDPYPEGQVPAERQGRCGRQLGHARRRTTVGLPGEHVGDDGCDACTVTESGADDAKASWETSSTVTSRYPRSRSSASGDAPAPTSMTVAVGSVAPVMRRSLVAACCWCSSFSLCALQVVV